MIGQVWLVDEAAPEVAVCEPQAQPAAHLCGRIVAG